ncbi:putative NuA4 complex subunit EAF3 [Lucilia cuprina]|uniref:Mortality factor 4-like protein 1 n=1 Tax=Lucilia cuprina TaxID=7375 RepID=A0A0L0CPR4_LUCCU|nr:NuA4 complex subunit EAF3 like protein [Lucilia cuprina]KNC34172.1 putative NuA4 complex subunit EAF3 [Lucilia cuprina]
MQPKYKFAEGEKVLCFHGPLIYEAKALKSTTTKDKQLKYFVHYAGWNKNWDEWVPEHRVLKYNETNLQRQKELQKEHDAKKEKNKKGTPKGKKGETMAAAPKESGAVSSGGSESRASTPSKELNTSASAATASGATTATGGGRGNRSKQNATPVHSTETKKDNTAKEDTTTTKEDKDEPATKKKRGTSTSTNPDKTANTHTTVEAKTTNTSSTAATTVTTSTTATTAATTTATTTVSAANSASAASTPSSVNRLDSCVESEETFLAKIEVKIKIPDELKQCLADDWDAITRQHKLLDIPAKITVQDIVDQYINLKKSAKSSNACKELAISDVLNGVIEYFNVMLGSQLLYKFERPQYAEILQQYPDTPLSKLYGSFHLLRLFVKLGSMLGYSALDEKSMQMLLVHLHDFLKFMVKNSATFFSMSSFVNVTPEYHRHTQ